ncbi:MAG: trypsin-like serine protease [Ruminococcaceae bacterium]|nr:trypsin-like serine protease [Oscillospiraceae bacterium]
MDEIKNTDYTSEEPSFKPEGEAPETSVEISEEEISARVEEPSATMPGEDVQPDSQAFVSPEAPEAPVAPETPEVTVPVTPAPPAFSQAPGAMPPPKRDCGESQPPHMDRGFSHSGEYRYSPPYSDSNARDSVYEKSASAPVSPTPEKNASNGKKEKVKTVRTFSTAALVFILIGAIILSFASGMLGALLVTGGLEPADEVADDANNKDSEKDNDDGDLVIDRVEEDVKDDDSGEGTEDAPDQLTGTYDLSDVCAVVSASVVEITTEFNKTQYGYYQYVQEGAGSGVIISRDGYIITNAHVITDSESGKLADSINIRLNSGEEYEAKIIGSDTESDIALIKVDGKGLSAARVGNSDSIKVGEQVIAVGNPLGELGGTVTSGIVSATNREINVENNKMTLIQIDAAINPGNSGGGLFNTKGELIGIVNAKTTDVTVEGLGFAIPVNEAVNVAEELEKHGYVTGKTHIGISLTDVTDSFTAYYYFRSESTGVYITSVQEGYNEDVLEYGDRITAINDVEVSSTADVKEIVSESKVGDKLIFTVSRQGKLKDVEVTCYEYVPQEDVSFDEE